MRYNVIQITELIQKHIDNSILILEEEVESKFDVDKMKEELLTNLLIVKKIIELYYK